MSIPERIPRKEASAQLELENTSSEDRINAKRTDELVFVLCGPIGTPLHKVADLLDEILTKEFKYDSKIIQLSKFIERHIENIPPKPFDRILALINKGNELRKTYTPPILAELTVREIALRRAKNKVKNTDTGSEFNPPSRTCHIIDSVKNKSELDLLRSIYGDVLHCIGVYCSPNERWINLEERKMSSSEIGTLIDRDSGEELSEGQGQMVDKTFPQSDFFLKIDETGLIEAKTSLTRFIKIILGVDLFTPSIDENAMYMAATAACNSACLSRQVGAAITDPEGNLVSVGWNDVPKYLGGLYSTTSNLDHRCYRWENFECHNDSEKEIIREEIIQELIEKKLIQQSDKSTAIEVLKGSRVKDLLEFSRAVHAEMHAIISAGDLGRGSLKRHKLYCTTYPCHSCARHIVAAGITEVFFIQPYTKSLATRLHKDSITDSEEASGKVRLIPFNGIAPNRYRSLFEKRHDRKNGIGKFIAQAPENATVRTESFIESYPALEALVVQKLEETDFAIQPHGALPAGDVS